MKPLICSVAIISLSIASTCIANTDDNNVIHLNIVSADHPYKLTYIPSDYSGCRLADSSLPPKTLSLIPGAAPKVLNIALQSNKNCQIHYSSASGDLWINIFNFGTSQKVENRINYRDGATPLNGFNLYDTLAPTIAYSNQQPSSH